ncbi:MULTISPECIES: helix-turn-helix domain-containing protein [unclassified Treponema]|uniref:helix-turn-helix domain-containing protein n=1 Tax=unclassified Treponema TaxID=2638727 RepID=UPI0020A39191|nr:MULTISPECIES: helix-turn-helix transcriptional regulator [unclassified Treponema]UTC66890.1 helix-turn-helix transcriptional regulator [Treponema sp. OMZ 789]UTC69619.1 helix-turn-helix transcriptional regulator [Treponema sp. OMZ 790]UTC72333.1 helix-turn-helix transcriptional regulator [Treponema sp. OMZ 791]
MGYDYSSILAKNIKRIRHKLEMSQMELALRADVSIAFINAIENKQKWVSASTLSKITDALNTSPYELFLTDDINEKDLMIIAGRHSELIADLNRLLKKHTLGHCKNES